MNPNIQNAFIQESIIYFLQFDEVQVTDKKWKEGPVEIIEKEYNETNANGYLERMSAMVVTRWK